MSEFHITREYPHSTGKLWHALTDPGLVPLWTSTGRGGRPEGFSAEVGCHFRFVGKPVPGWNGIVDCEVLEVDSAGHAPPHLEGRQARALRRDLAH